MNRAAPTEKMKDPRDIRDRNFQSQSIRTLLTFLTEAGYDRMISPKILSAPTAKDFQFIFMFLYHQIDPHYEFTGKIEEEVPLLIRALGYPFYSDISKSHLYAVGSIHAWPGVLAMLVWMVELILVRFLFFLFVYFWFVLVCCWVRVGYSRGSWRLPSPPYPFWDFSFCFALIVILLVILLVFFSCFFF